MLEEKRINYHKILLKLIEIDEIDQNQKKLLKSKKKNKIDKFWPKKNSILS